MYYLLLLVPNIVYLGLMYGLHKPNINRYMMLDCNRLNSTHHFALTNCKKLVFENPSNIEKDKCVFDSIDNKIVEYPTTYIVLIYVFGTLALVCDLILLILLISKAVRNYKRKNV